MSDTEQQAGTPAAAEEEEEEDLDALWNDSRPARVVQPRQAPSSDEDSDVDSEPESEDSATKRRKAAEAKLKDFGEGADGGASAPAAPGLLPSAAAAFTDVDGPPAFLDPEATRPLASAVHHGIDRISTGAAAADVGQDKQRGGGGGKQREGWDISKMAPKLKGESKPEPGVISAAAVKYKPAEDAGEGVSAAQIAMLGGQWGRSAGGGGSDDEAGGGGGAPGAKPPKDYKEKGKATKPMGVEEFLDKGVGGALLPRKRQDRKDKEKEKRMRGQSTHHVWKSEAEMALRQQYD